MSGHPLAGHRFSQITRTFSDPDLQEQEGLLRNAAPELLAAAKAVIRDQEEDVRWNLPRETWLQLRSAVARVEGSES